MTIQSNIISQIKSAQLEALIEGNAKEERLIGMKKWLEVKNDGMRYSMNQVRVSKYGCVKELVLNDARKTRYSIHVGSDKMYMDLKANY